MGGAASVKSNLTYSSSSTVTHPPPFSKHSTAQGQGSARPALHAVWWGAHHTSPPLPPASSRSRPTPKTCRPADRGRPAERPASVQQRPGAHAARRIAHTPSARLDSPAARLATRRVKAPAISLRTGERAARRFRSLLVTAKRDRCICMTIQSCLRLQTS
jgi:hypothetical protein